mmetsp:Transcript_61291/g.169922  ORF Transcript_61291/g.169922 Transcript_61291/m.169922 type:complete len:201 (-) Transcript_61291:334-936(-)
MDWVVGVRDLRTVDRGEVVGQSLTPAFRLEGQDNRGTTTAKVTKVLALLHMVAHLDGPGVPRPGALVAVVRDYRARGPEANGGHGDKAEAARLDDPEEALARGQPPVPGLLVVALRVRLVRARAGGIEGVEAAVVRARVLARGDHPAGHGREEVLEVGGAQENVQERSSDKLLAKSWACLDRVEGFVALARQMVTIPGRR